MAEPLHLYIYNEIESGLINRIQNEINAKPEASELIVHISSPGGEVYTGWTVGNIIATSGKKSTAIIESICGSIATFIALKCDTVKMANPGQFMIHYARVGVKGNKNEIAESYKMLDQIDQALIDIYQKKTGLPRDAINQMMNEERTMTTSEAIKMGFVDEPLEALRPVASFSPTTQGKPQINKSMSKEKEQTILSKIEKLLGIKNMDEEKEDKPENLNVQLQDGTVLYVETEDGEVEGKRVFVANEEGNPTETPAPDGNHRLNDGRTITVENGIVTAVTEDESEAEGMDEEKKEMLAKIENLEAALAEAKQDKEQYQNEVAEMKAAMDQVRTEITNLKKVTVGGSFKADKANVKPVNKMNNDPAPKTGLDGFAEYLKSQRK